MSQPTYLHPVMQRDLDGGYSGAIQVTVAHGDPDLLVHNRRVVGNEIIGVLQGFRHALDQIASLDLHACSALFS